MKFLSFSSGIVPISILFITIGCTNTICHYHHAKRPHEKALSKVGVDCNLGYWEKKVADNIWIVDYVARYNRDVAALEYHNLYRCAELTLQEGYKYFVLLDNISNDGYRKYVSGEIGPGYRIKNYAVKDCYSAMTIKMYKDKPIMAKNLINASKVIKHYGKYIENEPIHTGYIYKDNYFKIKTILDRCDERD